MDLLTEISVKRSENDQGLWENRGFFGLGAMKKLKIPTLSSII
jgi:hypothetical protein